MTPLISTTESCAISEIRIPSRLLPVIEADVAEIAASISQHGMATPIHVRRVDGAIVLLSGALRLAASRALGQTHIVVHVVDCDDVTAAMFEIIENLHRRHLTALQIGELAAAYKRLKEVAGDDGKLPQVGAVSGGGRGKTGGARAAGRDLGLSKSVADRAMKIGSLSPEAMARARLLGLDDNAVVLLAAANEEAPEAQVAALVASADERKRKAEAKNATLDACVFSPEGADAIEVEDEPAALAPDGSVADRDHKEDGHDAPASFTEPPGLAGLAPSTPQETKHVSPEIRQALVLLAVILRAATLVQRQVFRKLFRVIAADPVLFGAIGMEIARFCAEPDGLDPFIREYAP